MSETTSSRTDARRLRGVLAPVLTPFHADLSPDARRLARHCRWLLAHGCTALAPFGTTSEANSLSVAARAGLLDAILEDGVPADRLLPGTGACSLTDAVRLTRRRCAAAAPGSSCSRPSISRPGEDGLFRFFAEVIERVGDDRLRVYLYHFPRWLRWASPRSSLSASSAPTRVPWWA
jgi:4-hydroxy-tetrahydrodipicolinate synthase